ncbi:FAD-dependent oxidoreductase [Maritimibacter fusiformis]|nr:FAD-dependent oxidoreductase [Maritimibacter fusiformis]
MTKHTMDIEDEAQTATGSRISRRNFFKAAAAGTSGVALGVVTVGSAAAQDWNEETEVVVVGSGGAALAAAVAALRNGAKVNIYEKGPVPGGTTGKSGGAFWVPNNPYMQEMGLEDPRDDAIRYMARLAYPHLYREDDAQFGMSQHTYDLLAAFYDNGARVTRTLSESGAMGSLMAISWDGEPAPDYFAHLPENKAPNGRTVNPSDGEGGSGYGAHMIGQLAAFCEAQGAPVITESQVTKIVLDDDRNVIGVEVTDYDGARMIRATKGVIFGTGGFTQNAEMRDNYLRVPVFGGCAVPTNQGDLVNMAIEIGAKLGNMNEAWHQQEVLEEVLEFSSVPSGTWFLGGDSMIAVNKYGHRLYDEKFVYNERTRTHLTWDAVKGEYTNLYQFMIFDDHAIEYGGMLMPPPGAEMPSYIIKGETLEELAANIDARLASLNDRIGHHRLADTFLDTLKGTIERFNGFAETGKDLDFNRGEQPIDKHFHKPGANNDKPNPWMYPITGSGPYYAIILSAGTLDTKGGPVTTADGQVVDVNDRPINGLYAVGNCMASPTGQAYFGAGGTLGPALTFGFMAGEHATS